VIPALSEVPDFMGITAGDLVRENLGRTRSAGSPISTFTAALSAVAFFGLANLACAASSAPTPEGGSQSDTSTAATEPNTPPVHEDYAIHAQSTFTFQYHPAFKSAYRGPQSLDPGSRGDETFDITLYGGLRLWQGAEIWINPGDRSGFWAKQHLWRRRIRKRRSVQARPRYALLPAASDFSSPDYQPRRRDPTGF
jgi:hypothetical protein